MYNYYYYYYYYYYRTGRICRRQICQYCFYSRSIFWFIAPQGRQVAPIKVKFGSEERTVGPLLSAKFDLDRFRGRGLRPQKLKKWEFYQYNFH